MNLYPVRATLHAAVAGAALVASGVALHAAAPVVFGSGVLLVIALTRGLSLLSGTRLRRAGFEMVWAHAPRVLVIARGEAVRVNVELRNRSADRVRAVSVRALASSMLDVVASPAEVEIAPSGTVAVDLVVVGKRTGRWGLHGLALELRGTPLSGEGLYEVPLVFSNPFGVEVRPAPLSSFMRSPRGGRSGHVADTGPAARRRGEGDELRELRDHVPSDPFKRIAWRATARRGRLMVRETERRERDVVWLVVDVSVDGWAGLPGTAVLDRAVDEVAALASRHLSRGDSVGFAAFASRPRAFLPPARGPAQAALISSALAGCSSMVDVDRCDLDENEVAQRVAEHLRPLTRVATPHRWSDLDELARVAETTRARAPFDARLPYAPSPRERTLRHYLACFGMEVAPRAEGERPGAEGELARTLRKLLTMKPRPTLVALWAPAPTRGGLVARGVRALRARHVEVRWTVPDPVPSVGASPAAGPVQESVDAAVRERARAERARGVAVLRSMGVGQLARPHVRPTAEGKDT